jgi:hypothetical protein
MIGAPPMPAGGGAGRGGRLDRHVASVSTKGPDAADIGLRLHIA